ncbi:succinylglutamate desuccinylase/aspartoacylase family protein [Crocinitomix catalasitica]|uniref:succinylglutamate desuccinylase/aspartoacylase family protein n=1 Tax=Crocinitomix catalasitica TaxID=184607 RepID=UPI0006877545|nr:succinylglutamate desuccinylase/aspartoacylase family protein [Crocinitomix catalasitica]
MELNGRIINPGERCVVQIPVANLPSGTEINLHAHVFNSKEPGQTILLTGGVHGDEINGIEIVRRAIKSPKVRNLKRGTIIAIPLVNVYGFINFSRAFPDGKDVNRSFPGTKNGSLASRIAYTFTNKILPHADYCMDFHTGGRSIYNYPQVRFDKKDLLSKELAQTFEMPYLIESSHISNSLRKTAFSKNIPMIVFEGGESSRIDEYSISEALKGIERVLVEKGMIEKEIVKGESKEIHEKSWVRANKSGIFIAKKLSGDYVEKGDELGAITDPNNSYQSKVTAKAAGYIFGHNNNPVVNKGDALYHIGNI